MIKEDVAYAKEQYKLAFAEYGKVRNHISEIKKKTDVLNSLIHKIQQEIADFNIEISALKKSAEPLKCDYERKRKHWEELRTMRGMLANQNHNVKRNNND